ncbi:YdcF family protein [Paracraurococcus ruber]|uniref:DUF218 domain-containing protein n=1 Tax=Paracraurococcus ruber TaxID=77675 RepID=A0ABS1CUN1_9PROT|nr:YdcF family protein [Paracraurococcus ruber]MBK1658006.1 hypothetical protein [Paracraurococcus ruber]TDG33814.1 YdcF family protein [Paracraurococcus ruber]
MLAAQATKSPPRRNRRLRWLLLPVLPALLLLASFAWFLRQAAAPPAEAWRDTDGIAVLTGGAERVETGLRLLREGRGRVLLVSGAHRLVGLPEVARLAAMETEDLAGRVALGHEAATTRGNAAEIAAWAQAAGLRSVRIVTAGYHMPRALLELRRAMPETELVPHPVTPAPLRDAGAAARLRTWSLLGREYLKWLAVLAGLPGPAAPPVDARR